MPDPAETQFKCTGMEGRSAEYVAHAADLCAHAFQLLLDMLVAAVHVVDAIEDRFAVCDEGGEDERCGRAKVGAHDGCSGEGSRAADGGSAAVDFDDGAHADELLHVHEAVLEDVLLD